ncbi:MAG: hypothetical protein AB8B64_00645 [Granulosicoccus sp.]
MLLHALECCGRQARWVLPLGLVGGFTLPWAAEPLSGLIGPSIWLLLFFSVVRLASSGALTSDAVGVSGDLQSDKWQALITRVLIAQLVFPLAVFSLATLIGLPDIWRLAATLVAAASPISGSPSLVTLLKGDGALALRWLIAGTVLLPLTCLPVLMIAFSDQPLNGLLLPSLKLLLLILTATIAGVLSTRFAKKNQFSLSLQALDGASAITLALMVIGLMSALHAPDTTMRDFLVALAAAVTINAGFQLLGASTARVIKHQPARIIGTGVIYGNRNVALYLTALPVSFTEPLLLFIACYQIPMYLTPLLGDFFYRRLE